MTERHRAAVRFDERVWRDAIRGFSGPQLQTALSARARLERDGVTIAELLPCQTLGPDQTQLAGCAKLYLPITEQPASRRLFAFVLQLARATRTMTRSSGSSSRSVTATPPQAYAASTNAPIANSTATSR